MLAFVKCLVQYSLSIQASVRIYMGGEDVFNIVQSLSPVKPVSGFTKEMPMYSIFDTNFVLIYTWYLHNTMPGLTSKLFNHVVIFHNFHIVDLSLFNE